MAKIVKLTESDLNRIVKKVIEESYWDRIFGKADVDSAKESQMRSKGYTSTGRDDSNYGEEPSRDSYHIKFDGEKYYEDDIEYADPYDTGEIPRVENGKLIIANPAWSL